MVPVVRCPPGNPARSRLAPVCPLAAPAGDRAGQRPVRLRDRWPRGHRGVARRLRGPASAGLFPAPPADASQVLTRHCRRHASSSPRHLIRARRTRPLSLSEITRTPAKVRTGLHFPGAVVAIFRCLNYLQLPVPWGHGRPTCPRAFPCFPAELHDASGTPLGGYRIRPSGPFAAPWGRGGPRARAAGHLQHGKLASSAGHPEDSAASAIVVALVVPCRSHSRL
jgi:hypothetical protein